MKALLASTLLFILTALAQAQQAPTTTFEQQRAASSAAVLQKYPAAKDPGSHLNKCADTLYLQWQAAKDWRIESPHLPMYLWDSAEIQRQLEVRLAQIRATRYVTPATAPGSPSPRLPVSKSGSSTTTVSGSGGVYTTHGGSAGGATIIHSGGGHYQIHTKDGQTRQVIITTP